MAEDAAPAKDDLNTVLEADGDDEALEKYKDSLLENANPLAELMAVGEDGLNFANKTAQWIAYERYIESERCDRLFFDPLAKLMTGKYGERLSKVFREHAPFMFAAIGEEGFLRYHAARTKFISERITEWSATIALGPKQVLNLGSGYDTRAYWDESLAGVNVYIEVDEAQVNDPKNKALEEIGELPTLVCPRQSISLDFSKVTTKDVVNHGFDVSVPTLFLLEGLIMYLEESAVRRLYEDIDTLACGGSCVVVNVAQTSKEHHRAAFADSIFLAKDGWTRAPSMPLIMFGEAAFAFGRYPDGAEANENLGFVFYIKT
jgi:methyltransferase (TIGR00027 family)